MKSNRKMIISIILVIIWMIVIFMFSAMTSDESNEKSKGAINKVVETVKTKKEEVINIAKVDEQKVENKSKSSDTTETINRNNDSKSYIVANKLNKPLRKCAHASVYFVLCIFVANSILEMKKRYKFLYYLISIVICFAYACTDEFHQIFVQGRTGQFTDVLIDTAGALLGGIIFYSMYKLRHKRENKVGEEVL